MTADFERDHASPGGTGHPRGCWRRLRAGVLRLRHDFDAVDDEYVPATSPRHSRRARVFWVAAVVLVVWPLGWILRPLLRRSFFHTRGADKVKAEARELWKTNPHEALLRLKSVNLALREAERAKRISPWRGSVEIPPCGRFRVSDRIMLDGVLYSYVFALGDYEAALAVCSETPHWKGTILQQVDCLVAMRRADDAIRVLEANLHLDNRRGDLR
jgi:hypothetical protein